MDALLRTPLLHCHRIGRVAALVLACLGLAARLAIAAPQITLSERCPATFEQVSNGTCELRSLYDSYARVKDHGGVQMALPSLRQGFTPQQIDLGRHLFFDPLLSADSRRSCASCHQPERGLSDGRPRAEGFGGEPLARRTPTLWNIGFATRLFWDGRATSLEEQATGPLFAANEMGNTPADLLRRINNVPAYRLLFAQAYPSRTAPSEIRLEDIQLALAAFQSTLVSLNSRYDRYVHGDAQAMTAPELRGMNVFRGFVARCSQCHTPPLFTNHELAVVGSPKAKGLPIDPGAGAEALGGDPLLRGAFKVPTLRNITRSGPAYFHAGQFATLREAVSFYNATRGHALPKGETQAIHWHVHMMKAKLDKADIDDIVAFLGALEDETASPRVPEAVPSGLPLRLAGHNSSSGPLPALSRAAAQR